MNATWYGFNCKYLRHGKTVVSFVTEKNFAIPTDMYMWQFERCTVCSLKQEAISSQALKQSIVPHISEFQIGQSSRAKKRLPSGIPQRINRFEKVGIVPFNAQRKVLLYGIVFCGSFKRLPLEIPIAR